MSERRHPHIVNLDEVEPRKTTQGTRFGAAMKHVGRATGARGIGCTYFEIEPGRTAFPHHYHCVNEEAAYILEGEGRQRIGDTSVPVRAGDFITYPTGPAHAHQLVNTGRTPLRYLCFSTLSAAEVVGYPDSKKLAAAAAPSYEEAMGGKHWVRIIVREDAGIGYYDGEDVG
jgi:uncharacterized cupin superfamily protein